jgi:hypothetical protein
MEAAGPHQQHVSLGAWRSIPVQGVGERQPVALSNFFNL